MAATTAGRRYSRRVAVEYTELVAGDLVDVSTSGLPYWVEVERVGVCDDDPERDDACQDPGCCCGVVFYVDSDPDSGGAWQWHLMYRTEVYARLCADDDWARVESENEAQAAAAAKNAVLRGAVGAVA